MSLLEAFAALFGLANIVLIVRRSVWNFPAALVMVSLTAIVLWDAKLYSDAGLQGFFFLMNLIGWWAWLKNQGEAGDIIVQRLRFGGEMACLAAGLMGIWGWGWLMARYTDASHPYWDASIAMLSVMAQILMIRRFINNWHWWIVINLLSIGLYWTKGLYWFTGLYGVFLGMAFWGLIAWRKAEAQQAKEPV